MPIADKLDADLKDAMRAKDQGRVAAIRSLRAKAQEAQNAPDFKGPADDAFYQKVIGSYVRQLEKSLADLASTGERGAALRATYQAEVAYYQQFLPKLLGEAETRKLVQEKVQALGAKDAKDVGKVIGALMKDHKGTVDPALTRRLVEEALKS